MYPYQRAEPTALRLDYYPFLADPDELSRRRYGIPIVSLAKLRQDLLKAGFNRLVDAIKRGRVGEYGNSEVEVFGFAFAATMAVLLNDRWVVSRLALAEAERAVQIASREADEALALLGSVAGLKTLSYDGARRPYREPVAIVRGVIVYRLYPFSLSFVEYVRAAHRLIGDDSWKPINLPVSRGRVYIDRDRLLRILKDVLTEYIEARIKSVGGDLAPSLAESLASYVEDARKILSEKRKIRVERGGKVEVPKGVIVEDAFPPCIRDLVERARKGENLSHHERFALATFMLNIGAEIDYVVDLFRNMPDFNEKITRYQVEHLAGLRGSRKKYRVYSCEKMRTLGICKADCENVRSPIQAYYRQLRKLAKTLRIGEKEHGAMSEEKS